MTTYDKHVEHLSNILSADLPNLGESQNYLDSDYRLKTLGLGAPPEMRYLRVNVGWPSLYLRAIEERLDIEGFRVSGDSDNVEDIWKWWQDNGLDEESGLGHMDALTFGRSYITVAAPGVDDDPGTPLIRLESPLSMYAEIDPRTRKVTRAVRLYKTDTTILTPDSATLYLPGETVYLKRSNGTSSPWVTDGPAVAHDLGIVPVVPITNRSRLSNRYGRSEITPEIKSLTDAAARTLMNLQAASEIMAVPMRVFFGVEKEAVVDVNGGQTVNDAYYGRIMALENEQGSAFQFSAADLRNFTEELAELAKQVASYTGLPPQYLSFSSDNPASAEAIQASESRLVKTCERKSRMFGGSWEQTMRLAKMVMGETVPDEFRRLETVWRDPSTPTYAAMADAATKLWSNGQGVVPKEQIRIDLGYTGAQREQMKSWDKEDNAVLTALAQITSAPAASAPKSSGDPVKPNGTQTAHG